jgi:hypothetical protein
MIPTLKNAFCDVASNYQYADASISGFKIAQTVLTPGFAGTFWEKLIDYSELFSQIYSLDYPWAISRIAGQSFSVHYTPAIQVGKWVWALSLIVPTDNAPTLIGKPIQLLKQATPYIILISQITITILELWTDMKNAAMKLSLSAVIIVVNQHQSLQWYFHHIVSIPLLSFRIYSSEGPLRYFTLHTIVYRTFALNPAIRGQVHAVVPSRWHDLARSLGVYPAAEN